MTPTHIDFFKLQAKNLLRDYKTQFKDNESGGLYSNRPCFFDVNRIVVEFDIDEDIPFTLMNAQHIIAYLAGFRKWTDLINAIEPELELAKLLFNNREDISIEDWKMYEKTNLNGLGVELRLEVFKQLFLRDGNTINEGKIKSKSKLKETTDMKKISLSEGIGDIVLAHEYELDPKEKYIIDFKQEIEFQSATMMSFQIMGPPPALQDYQKFLRDNKFDTAPTNAFVEQFYGIKPLWKTDLSQGIVVKAEDDDDYYVVMECSRENTGYKYAKIIVTMGGCY